MIESLYALLEKVGFNHPLHPMLTHVPMGMIIGAVVFSLAGFKWRNQHLNQTAYHCALLALLAIVPVIAAGLLDWQHLMTGSWNIYIIVKMVLAVILTLLLTLSVVLWHKRAEPQTLFILYLLCMACAGGIGYSGGELVYGG